MTIVGIQRFGSPRMEFFKSDNLPLKVGVSCIVKSENGLDFGEVVIEVLPPCWSEKFLTPGKVVRIVTERDKKTFRQKLVLERQAFELCQHKNEKLKIPMKLVRVTYAFELKKATFFYTATGRVDFRQLVRELARELRIRVEMCQIGVRDEAKMMAGCGTCGCTLCCSTFLGDFQPVSMKMAKKQNLVLNPSKVSGVCGRLKCCLAYEYHEQDQKKVSCKSKKDEVN